MSSKTKKSSKKSEKVVSINKGEDIRTLANRLAKQIGGCEVEFRGVESGGKITKVTRATIRDKKSGKRILGLGPWGYAIPAEGKVKTREVWPNTGASKFVTTAPTLAQVKAAAANIRKA